MGKINPQKNSLGLKEILGSRFAIKNGTVYAMVVPKKL